MSFRKGQQSDQEMEIHAHMKTPNTKMLLRISNIKAFLPSAETNIGDKLHNRLNEHGQF